MILVINWYDILYLFFFLWELFAVDKGIQKLMFLSIIMGKTIRKGWSSMKIPSLVVSIPFDIIWMTAKVDSNNQKKDLRISKLVQNLWFSRVGRSSCIALLKGLNIFSGEMQIWGRNCTKSLVMKTAILPTSLSEVWWKLYRWDDAIFRCFSLLSCWPSGNNWSGSFDWSQYIRNGSYLHGSWRKT